MELVGRADPSLEMPLADVLADSDVVVDFTTPEAAPGNVRECVGAGVHAVVGTSGFDLDEPAGREVESADGEARVFVAPNFAIGAVLMMQLAREAVAAHARVRDRRAPPRAESSTRRPGRRSEPPS